LFWLSGVGSASRLVSEGLILSLADTCLVGWFMFYATFSPFIWLAEAFQVVQYIMLLAFLGFPAL
jgi:hypothetical protein